MKTILLLSVLLLTSQNPRDAFWQQFKTAVTNKNVDAIAALSQFPIGMSYGIASVKSKVDLRKRYRKVFNEQTDAAACFKNAKPQADSDPKHFYVVCPDEAGNEVIVYNFALTKSGWKFTDFDNINE